MLDSFTLEFLETLKTILSLSGAAMSLLFGIIGTTFKTHKEITEKRRGKDIEVSKPTKWLWIAIIGLIVSSLISSFAFVIDNKISSLQNEIAAHPFNPFHIKAIITVKPNFTSHSLMTMNTIKKYLVENINKINKPSDFSVTFNPVSGTAAIFCGGKVPTDLLQTNMYDQNILDLHEQLSNLYLPQLTFCIYPHKGDSLNKANALYDFTSGPRIIDTNLIKQSYPSLNMNVSYSIDGDNTITAVYSAPIDYKMSTGLMSSLYAYKNDGIITVSLANSQHTNFTLNRILLYCGPNSELTPIDFSESDIVVKDGAMKLYQKSIGELLKPDTKIRY